MNFKLLKKGSKVYSVLKLKCPKCQEGNLFVYRNPYKLKGGLKMDDNCTVCGQDFVIEPGFYYGALWMSYPIVVVLIIGLAAFFYFYLDYQLISFISIMFVTMMSLQPLIIRFGRAIWINVFVKYEEKG